MIIDIVILCPVEVEFKHIRKILNNTTSCFIKQGSLSFDLGQMDGLDFIWNVAIAGPASKAISFETKTRDILQYLKPKYIFLAGIAGGVKDVKVGDILIGDKAYGYESGKETPEGFAARPDAIVNESEQLLTIARKVARNLEVENGTFKIYFGSIASGEKVIASTKSETYRIIKQYYNDTLGVEKEAHAFALMARRAKIAYLNIRCISDLLEGKEKSDAEGNQEKAAERVAFFLKRLVLNLPLDKQEVILSSNIRFTRNKFLSTIYRKKTSKGILQFKNDYINLLVDNENKIIRNILELEYLKIPGDFSKNWVRVKYVYNSIKDEIYFSDSSLLRGGPWFGGSKDILNNFMEHQNNQIQI